MDTLTSIAYTLNSLTLLVFSLSVLLMFAGFTLINAGMVRAKNTTSILCQQIGGFAISCLAFVFISQHALFSEITSKQSLLSVFSLFLHPTQAMHSLTTNKTYSYFAARFFHMLLPIISLSIVIALTAERLKLWAFFLFTIIFTGLIYPPLTLWLWGQGFLFKLGFIDDAGAGIIFLSGAVAGLVGTILLKPRNDKYLPVKVRHPLSAANLPLAINGLLLICIGSIGFNAGTHYLNGQVINVDAIIEVCTNTLIAASAGMLVALIITKLFYNFVDITLVANGTLAGLACIAACPTISMYSCFIVSASASLLALLGISLLEKINVDDPMGFFSSFGIASIWGLIAAGFFQSQTIIRQQNPLSLDFGHQVMAQLTGIIVIVAWVGLTSAATWLLVKYLIGIRIHSEDERRGLDILDCGMAAYPEFTRVGR